MRSSTVTPAPQPPVNRYIHLGLTPAQQSIILGGPGQKVSPPLPKPPLKATSPSVPSGSGGGSTTPTLTWLDGGGATSYDVYFNSAFIGNQATTSYTPDPLSYLTTYTWRVDAVNADGTTAGDTWSFTTIIAAPVNSVLPAITGTAQVGDTLTGGNGTWTNTPTSYTYRWLAGGVAIGGATASTFLLTTAQLGAVVTFEVTASNAGGAGTAATSAATGVVLPALHSLATAWAANVVTNGGAAPSTPTVAALSDFCYALDAASITSKLNVINCFVPDSLIAASTPLLDGGANNPWLNQGPFVSGDLSVNGLQGNGSSKYFRTGILTNSFMTASSASTVYYNVASGNGSGQVIGCAGAVGKVRSAWDGASGLGNYWSAFDDAITFGIGNNTAWKQGYICNSKTTTTRRDIYFADSSNAHTSLANNTVLDSGSHNTPPGDFEVAVFAGNEGGTYNSQIAMQLSFVALGTALSASDSLALYNAVQALRTALGGGYV